MIEETQAAGTALKVGAWVADPEEQFRIKKRVTKAICSAAQASLCGGGLG